MAFPDCEKLVKDLLEADSGVTALVSSRVFMGIPSSPTWPLITIKQIGGTNDGSQAEIARDTIDIQCWGSDRNKAQAAAVKDAVRTCLAAIIRRTTVGGQVCHGANIDSIVYVPDQDSGRPRYIVTTTVTATVA